MALHLESKRLLPAALLGMLVCGCGTLPSQPAPVPMGESVSPTQGEDLRITRNVRDQLARDLPLAEIAVATAQGKVELRGNVEDTDTARRAVKGALAIDGVRGVVNELVVAPDGAGRGPALSVSTL